MELANKALLEQLIAIQGVASDESSIKMFIKNYVETNKDKWVNQPQIIDGKGFQDTLILVFGKPRTAIYAHMDTIGYSTGYHKELIRVGGPKHIDGTHLVGKDSSGEVEVE